MKTIIVSGFTAAFLVTLGASAFAQSDEAAKTVGRKGATQLGINFQTTTSISTSYYGTTNTETNLFGGVDVGRFVSNKFLVRFGLSGFGTVGGGGGESGYYGGAVGGGSSVSFNVLGGGLFYLTPQKPQSLYVGGDMSVPMSKAGAGDPYMNSRVGLQAAIRSNASIFFEGGYGTVLSRGGSGSGSLQSNLGVRVLF
jgi:hypothetical protein